MAKKCVFCKENPAVIENKFCSKTCMYAEQQREYLIEKEGYKKEQLEHITDPAELPLSDNQKDFVYEYVKTKNVVNSYRTAFPSAVGLNNREVYRKATFLLKLPFIRAYANEIVEELRNRFIEDKFNVLFVLDTIINTNIKRFLNPDGTIKSVDEIDEDSAVAIKKLTRRYHKSGELMEETIELEDKMKAIQLVGKYYQMFNEKKEVDVKITHLLDVIKKDDDVDIDTLIKKAKEAVEQKVNERYLQFKEEQVIDATIEETEKVKSDGKK